MNQIDELGLVDAYFTHTNVGIKTIWFHAKCSKCGEKVSFGTIELKEQARYPETKKNVILTCKICKYPMKINAFLFKTALKRYEEEMQLD